MSKPNIVKEMWADAEVVISRPVQTYTVAVATYALFNVSLGGAIYIETLGAVVTGAPDGATRVLLSANGVDVDAAAVAIDGVVGTVVLSSLNIAGTLINAAGMPETIAAQSRFLCGTQPAAVGVIQAVFSVGVSWTGVWYMVYRRMSSRTRVTLG